MSEEQVLNDNQVLLSDGRIVEMREQKGSDEFVVAGQLGDLFTQDGAGQLIYMNALIARTVVSINSQPVPPMRKYAELREFADTFKLRDWNKLRMLYVKINGLDDDAEGNGEE